VNCRPISFGCPLLYLLLPKQQYMTTEDLELILMESESSMEKAIAHLETELTKVRAGKATPSMLDGIGLEYYGNHVPISQVANISVMDARTISIQPWEKNMLGPVEKAILQANIGVTPSNDGNFIRIFLPPLTEERRKELVKRANGEGEHAKVAVRNIRRDGIEKIKKLQKDGLSEDACKDGEGNVQTATDKAIALIDKHLAAKEKDIMTV